MSKADGGITSWGTVGSFLKEGACSNALFSVMNRAFEHPMRSEQTASMPLAGGIMQHGYQCGMVWGAAFASGAEAHRRFGAGPLAETKAIVAAKKLIEAFRADNDGHRDCYEITELNKRSTTWQMVTYFMLKGGTIGCFRRAARFAPPAYRAINAAFADEASEPPAAPVSCAAELVRKMGGSELHATTAAGLAGGIGLSGGGCGALGAAIWLKGYNRLAAGERQIDYRDPRTAELVERFIKATDYEFECPKIAGRPFETVADHAAFVQGGGCAKVLELLAAA